MPTPQNGRHRERLTATNDSGSLLTQALPDFDSPNENDQRPIVKLISRAGLYVARGSLGVKCVEHAFPIFVLIKVWQQERQIEFAGIDQHQQGVIGDGLTLCRDFVIHLTVE